MRNPPWDRMTVGLEGSKLEEVTESSVSSTTWCSWGLVGVQRRKLTVERSGSSALVRRGRRRRRSMVGSALAWGTGGTILGRQGQQEEYRLIDWGKGCHR